MKKYAALFRGINVGGKNLLPMKELTALLEQLGCEKVKTYIQSGNVVFQTEQVNILALNGEIRQKIQETRGFTPEILILAESDLGDAIQNNPFQTEEGKALHFFFTSRSPDAPDLDSLISLKSPSEEFSLKGHVLYLHAPDGIGRSRLAARVEKALGVPVTARNWNTVKKIDELISRL